MDPMVSLATLILYFSGPNPTPMNIGLYATMEDCEQAIADIVVTKWSKKGAIEDARGDGELRAICVPTSEVAVPDDSQSGLQTTSR